MLYQPSSLKCINIGQKVQATIVVYTLKWWFTASLLYFWHRFPSIVLEYFVEAIRTLRAQVSHFTLRKNQCTEALSKQVSKRVSNVNELQTVWSCCWVRNVSKDILLRVQAKWVAYCRWPRSLLGKKRCVLRRFRSAFRTVAVHPQFSYVYFTTNSLISLKL